MKIVFLIQLILCAVISILLTKIGYGLNTWQWWVGCGCVWISYQLGRFADKEEQNAD